MADTTPQWTVRLTNMAEQDFASIIEWTAEHFGMSQADIYADHISEAIDALTEGPGIIGVKTYTDVSDDIYVLHAARSGKKARHFILFRVESQSERILQVVRILHDSMDIKRHIQ